MNSLGSLLKTEITGLNLRSSDSAVKRWGPGTCIANEFQMKPTVLVQGPDFENY